MKLVGFRYDGRSRIGCSVGKRIVDLHDAFRVMLESEGVIRARQIADAYIPPNMVEFLQGGEESMAYARKAVDFVLSSPPSADPSHAKVIFNAAEVKLEAPLLSPGKMICVGHNYREHILEMGRGIPTHPVIFAKFRNTIIGPQDDIPYYPITEELDYEAEFAFIIGKRARNVKQEDALDYVCGYTIVNDVSYRDLQRRTLQWLQGKTVEGSAPMGPWIVTRDELPDPSGLEISLTVNGEERQRSNTANLVFTVPYLVEFLSQLVMLEPGDIVLTGTPGGVGIAREPKAFLKDGDIVEIKVDGVGVLRNRVKQIQSGTEA